jgi:23S rRNA (cytidine2498-2'-O)-methyltransferase
MLINKPFTAIYVADPTYLSELCMELNDIVAVVNNLVFSNHQKSDVCFALDVWLEPIIMTFQSISEAVQILRRAGKYWFLNPIENIRRSRLIENELRKLPALQSRFPLQIPTPDIGCFSLLDKNTLVYSKRRWKKPPLGNYQFVEDKTNPPNRAYLKLWEALTLLEDYPRVGEIVLDLGASPGGWSYVMQTLGTLVTAVDKAPLDSTILKLPNLHFLQQSAFALDPMTYPKKIDWLLSDIACYPERTYDLVCQWIASGKANKIIFTIKLQGETNWELIKKFQAIPQGRVLHLFHNKHEATFFYPAPAHLFPFEMA